MFEQDARCERCAVTWFIGTSSSFASALLLLSRAGFTTLTLPKLVVTWEECTYTCHPIAEVWGLRCEVSRDLLIGNVPSWIPKAFATHLMTLFAILSDTLFLYRW